ncbi:hypothetical protein Ancab_031737 [Ancistrocladus abbreviatus]
MISQIPFALVEAEDSGGSEKVTKGGFVEVGFGGYSDEISNEELQAIDLPKEGSGNGDVVVSYRQAFFLILTLLDSWKLSSIATVGHRNSTKSRVLCYGLSSVDGYAASPLTLKF